MCDSGGRREICSKKGRSLSVNEATTHICSFRENIYNASEYFMLILSADPASEIRSVIHDEGIYCSSLASIVFF